MRSFVDGLLSDVGWSICPSSATLDMILHPALPIEKALDIAHDYLKKHGHAGSVAIAGLSVERAALGGKSTHWYAKWAPTIPLDGGRKEFGIEIEMDGTIARIVDKKAPK